MKSIHSHLFLAMTVIITLAFVQSAWAAPSAFETTVLGDSPFLYYRLDEAAGTTAFDDSGNGYDGSYVNGPLLGQTGAGTGGGLDDAVLFDGVDDHILAGSGSNVLGSMLDTLTFEFVISTNELTTDATTTLIGTRNGADDTNMSVGFNEVADGTARLFLRDSTGGFFGGYFSDPGMFDGDYHHLVFTYDNDAETPLRAYLDGFEKAVFTDGTGLDPNDLVNFAAPMTVMANNNTLGGGASVHRYLDGTLDEVAIYTTAFDPNDVAAHFSALGIPVPNQWAIDAGGSFNDPNNWTDVVVPTSDAVFGSAISSSVTVTLDSPVSLNTVTFDDNNQYTIAGPSALTLTGAASISTSGTHVITADIAGTAGLQKLGFSESDTLVLPNAKSYTGDTDVQGGTLNVHDLDAIDNQASTDLNIADGARVALIDGVNGTLASELTGANGVLLIDTSDNPANKITISRDNSSFGGLATVRGGTLELTNGNGLGTGSPTTSNMTRVLNEAEGGLSAKLALSGGIMVANETVELAGRSSTNDTPVLTSTGNNFWNGVVFGLAGSNTSNIYIESSTASQTLTIDEVFANDNATPQTFVFSGPGDIDITSRLSDADLDLNDVENPTVKSFDNVGVVKRGSGDLTLNYASSLENDYWFGPTTIEEGRIVVSASGGTDGELRSLDINIHEGAELNATAFTTYSQQPGQTFRGSGTVNVGAGSTFALFAHGDLAPGESVGAVGRLKVTGDSTFATGLGGGSWTFDIGNSSDPNDGDRLVVSGGFTASSSATTVNVAPANGHLDDGTYTIVSHTGGTNAFTPTAQITDANGNPLTARQTVSVNGSTGGQINVVVDGTEASQTWVGGVNNAWDVSGTSNWTGTGSQYFDLDQVTFNDTASSFDVEIDPNGSVHPGSITFSNNSNTYNFSGTGGIVGNGAINVTGTGQVNLGNEGNNFSGLTTINAGSSLRISDSSTGSISNSGTLSLGVAATTDVLVQDGLETIGAGGFYVFAFEAEDWQVETVNDPDSTAWVNVSDPNGSGGMALRADNDDSITETTTATQNFVTYNLKFAEPGTYEWFTRLEAFDIDGDSDTTDNDSFYTLSDDMDSGDADPTAVGSRIDNGYGAPAGVLNSTGSPGDPNTYTWVRNSTTGTNANEFHTITVTQADVDAGITFKFKVATREAGMTLDKFVFVADPNNFSSGPFGSVTDINLDDANSVPVTQELLVEAGTVLDVNGDLTLADGSTLSMLLSSPNLHDQIDISGSLTADGTLDIGEGGSGFAASLGDVFDIFIFGDPNAVSGTFDTINLPTLTSGLLWDTSNLLVTGEISVTSTPGDFNLDGSVDGFDFLEWQINPSVGNLADWENNYGMSGSPVSAVPEPGAAVLLVAGLLASGTVRRRRIR